MSKARRAQMAEGRFRFSLSKRRTTTAAKGRNEVMIGESTSLCRGIFNLWAAGNADLLAEAQQALNDGSAGAGEVFDRVEAAMLPLRRIMATMTLEMMALPLVHR